MAFINNLTRLLNKAVFSTPTRFNAATAVIGTPLQTVGTGLSDLTSGGTYTATVDHVYTVKISTAAGTDKFQLKTDSGSFGAEVSLTGSAQTLANGVTVTFAATTGHTLGDTWTITVSAGVAITAAGLNSLQVNAAGSGAEVKVFNGSASTGALLYDNAALAVTTSPLQLGYSVSNVYVVVYASSTYPDIIVGTS